MKKWSVEPPPSADILHKATAYRPLLMAASVSWKGCCKRGSSKHDCDQYTPPSKPKELLLSAMSTRIARTRDDRYRVCLWSISSSDMCVELHRVHVETHETSRFAWQNKRGVADKGTSKQDTTRDERSEISATMKFLTWTMDPKNNS